MRSRNISVFGRSLKPNTRFYPFFDNVNVENFVVPKLIEIEMVSGTFTSGENIEGSLNTDFIRFRLAKQNHKYGSYDSPTITYVNNPYDLNSTIPSNYSSTSTILNVDIESLGVQSESQYYGSIKPGMRLIGKTSTAVAIVKTIRLISDNFGSLLCSFYIPDPSNASNPKFTTGTKTFVLSTSSTNSISLGDEDSNAEANFTSSGLIETLEAIPPSPPPPPQPPVPPTQPGITTSRPPRPRRQYVDPLAQSFQVTEEKYGNGVYITKCDVFFKSKDTNNIPITLQLRTMQAGFPTQNVLAEVELEPSQVNISSDATVPTSFTFKSPVYLDSGVGFTEYSIVLLSNSDNYNVWISRMGEEDIVTTNFQNGNKVIVSKQPTLGSLFKSQNASTWDASQYEDLKFKLYRANFTSQTGTITLYNPILDAGNNQVAKLRLNPITAYPRSLKVKLSSNLNASNISLLQTGYALTQTSNSNFTSKVKSIIGEIATGTTLTIVNSGSGFTTSITSYTNVDLVSLTGTGSGAKATIGVGTGVVYSASITNGGSGYSSGDVITLDYTDTGNRGKDVVLSLPSSSGIISASNAIIIDEVQGDLTISSGDLIVNGTTITGIYPSESPEVLTDGLHFKVNHNNHGMYSQSNLVTLSKIQSDVPPTKLITGIGASTSVIQVEDANSFQYFEGKLVSAGSTGYVIINNEIIGYTAVNTTSAPYSITVNATPSLGRGVDQTTPTSHLINDLVFKYEFNGISLRKINKQHSMLDTNINSYPIKLDDYHLKIANDSNKYFKQYKTGGSYSDVGVSMASQNISYNILRPITNIMIPPDTSVESSIRTVTASSVNGNESSFVDKGFEDFSLESNNTFNTMRGIYSRINEIEYLDTPNNKSLALQIQLQTNDTAVSPKIDLTRIAVSATMNRLNMPITDYITDSRISTFESDPIAAVYVSKIVRLQKPSDSLKVLFDAYRHASNDIRVAYRIFRNDTPEDYQKYQLFPGYGNIDSRGNTIDIGKSTGLPDLIVTPSGNEDEFKSYEYNAKSDVLFTGFQIKIMLSGTDQANVPKIRDLRIIATL
jgi:hypothetical protein